MIAIEHKQGRQLDEQRRRVPARLEGAGHVFNRALVLVERDREIKVRVRSRAGINIVEVDLRQQANVVLYA